MDSKTITEYCRQLPAKDLIDHISSLLPSLQDFSAKGKRNQASQPNSEPASKLTVRERKFAELGVGRQIVFHLSGLHGPKTAAQLPNNQIELLKTVTVDAQVVFKSGEYVIIELVAISVRVKLTPNQVSKSILSDIKQAKFGLRTYYTVEMLNNFRTSNNQAKIAQYEMILQLCVDSPRFISSEQTSQPGYQYCVAFSKQKERRKAAHIGYYFRST